MAYRKLGRNSSARKALFKSILTSFFKHERIETTEAKAKEIVDDAKAKSAEIRKAANVYADGILKRAEESLTTQLTDIKKTRSTLANSQKK